MKVDNAIIMAAGTASRFAPISYERPKALIEVKGEVLIERQIKQLHDAGIEDIIIVTGYKAEQFNYLKEKYGVMLIHNSDYLNRNNNGSIYAVKKYLKNSYICSSDNYFKINPFENDVEESYYSSIYVEGRTNEWCIKEEDGWIYSVEVGGTDSWVMLGHVFWSESYSMKFLEILESEYAKDETSNKLWETIYIEHIEELPMKIRKYKADYIFEFDTLDELREFDTTYKTDTRSIIIKSIADQLGIPEEDIIQLRQIKDSDNEAIGFQFTAGKCYKYYYESKKLEVELC